MSLVGVLAPCFHVGVAPDYTLSSLFISISFSLQFPLPISGMPIAQRKLIPEIALIFAPFAPFFRQWNSLERIKRIPPSVAMLLLSGQMDQVIPPRHMQGLWDAANPPDLTVGRCGKLARFQNGEHSKSDLVT